MKINKKQNKMFLCWPMSPLIPFCGWVTAHLRAWSHQADIWMKDFVWLSPLTFGLSSDTVETAVMTLARPAAAWWKKIFFFKKTQIRTILDRPEIVYLALSIEIYGGRTTVMWAWCSWKQILKRMWVEVCLPRRSPSKDISVTEEEGGKCTNQLKDCIKSGPWLLRDRCRITSMRTLTMTPSPPYTVSQFPAQLLHNIKAHLWRWKAGCVSVCVCVLVGVGIYWVWETAKKQIKMISQSKKNPYIHHHFT